MFWGTDFVCVCVCVCVWCLIHCCTGACHSCPSQCAGHLCYSAKHCYVVLVKMKYNHDSQCLQLSFISCQVARFAEELTSNVLIAATVSGWLEQYWVITALLACSIVSTIALTNVVFCPHIARMTEAVLCVPSHWLKWYSADCQDDWSSIVCTITLTKVIFCRLPGWLKQYCVYHHID